MHAIRPQHIPEKPAPDLRVANTEIQNILTYLPHAQLMPDTVKIRKRGVMTLPKALREKYQLEEGDVLHLVDVDGGLRDDGHDVYGAAARTGDRTHAN